MLCPGGIVCIVPSTTRLLLKVAWTLSLNWALSTVSGMNHQQCLTGWDQKMMSKQNTFHIQDILFNISCCLCSILGLFFQEPFDIFEQFFPNFVWDHLASFWRHFLNTYIFLEIFFRNILCQNFYLDQVFHSDPVEAALLHHVLADPLHLILPAALLESLYQLGL